MLRYCGYDPTETQFNQRATARRFTPGQLDQLKTMAKADAGGKEIAAALGVKVQAVRAKCSQLGISLRRKIKASRLRMVVPCTAGMYAAAAARPISIQTLNRRLLGAISKVNLFDEILGPIPRPHSLGAAAVGETKAATVILSCPQLCGVATLR
jgi:hypothetical protein